MNVLKKSELGLIRPSTFKESIRMERLDVLRHSLYRDVEVKMKDRPGMGGAYMTLDIEHSQRYLLTGCANGGLEIFDLDPISQSPKQRCRRIAAVMSESTRCHKAHCNWVQWYPLDSGMFISSSHDKTVKVWDANQMAVVETFNFDQSVKCHDMCSIETPGSAHSVIAVATDESNVRLVDIRTGSKSHHLPKHHEKGVICVCWSPYDSNILVSGGRDGKILVWDTRSGKSFLKALTMTEEGKPPGHPIVGLKFTPPSKCFRFISLNTDGELRVWDALTMNFVFQTDVSLGKFPPTKMRALKLDVACHSHSLKENDVVFVPTFNQIDMVSLSSGKRHMRLKGHLLPAYSCAYRGDDYQELYTASYDRTIGCFRPQFDENPGFYEIQSSVQKRKKGEGDVMEDNWSDSD